MDFDLTERQAFYRDRVKDFIETRIRPRNADYKKQLNEGDRWQPIGVIEELKPVAREAGLWNLFMPPGHALKHVDESFEFEGTQLTNLEYALCAEEMGRLPWSSEVFNCSAPDTGNMEVFHRYGTLEQKEQWLRPLMNGEIRSAFLMTEPAVASSDATNIGLRIERDGDEYVLNGTKWFSSGALRPACQVLIVMGKTDPSAPRHLQQSMLAVAKDTPGIRIGRTPHVFGYDHAGGHPEIHYEDARVPVDNLLGEEGGGFAISQARLGPGRIHHCMRSIGVAERALGIMVERALQRTTFGTSVAHKGLIQDWIAEARISIDMAREYVLRTAHLMDTVGNKAAATEISGIKVAIPRMALEIIDRAIQVHGAAGVTQFTPLAEMYASMRTLRIADGPDEVHKMTIARREILKYEPGFRMTPSINRDGVAEGQPFARP